MVSTAPEPAAEGEPLATLTEEVGQLRDLFQRRLFEDKAKNRLYDELYDQLALARGGLSEQLLAPLFGELLLVVDRIESLGDDDVLLSIVVELTELLERRGVRRVAAVPVFDATIHEAVGVEDGSGLPERSVVRVVRPGYLMGERLLRPERVVLAGAAEDPGELP